MARATRSKAAKPPRAKGSRTVRWQQRLLFLRGALLLAAALALLMIGLLPGEANFTANAQTLMLELTLRPQDRLPGWGKPAGAVGTSAGESFSCSAADFELAQERAKNVPIRIRISDDAIGAVPSADQGAAEAPFAAKAPTLVASFNEGQASIGRLTCDGVEMEAIPPFSLLFRPAKPGDGVVVPFMGVLRLGGDVASPVSPDPPEKSAILLSGILTVRAMAWPFRTGRAENEVALNTGDILTFVDRDGAPVPSAGIIRTESSALENSSMKVVAQGEAYRAKVDSTYATGVTAAYAPTLWARIQAMGEWAVLLALATLLLGILDLVKDYFVLKDAANGEGRDA